MTVLHTINRRRIAVAAGVNGHAVIVQEFGRNNEHVELRVEEEAMGALVASISGSKLGGLGTLVCGLLAGCPVGPVLVQVVGLLQLANPDVKELLLAQEPTAA